MHRIGEGWGLVTTAASIEKRKGRRRSKEGGTGKSGPQNWMRGLGGGRVSELHVLAAPATAAAKGGLIRPRRCHRNGRGPGPTGASASKEGAEEKKEDEVA